MGDTVLHSKAVSLSRIFLLQIFSVPFLLQCRCIPGPWSQFFESETPVAAANGMFPVGANGYLELRTGTLVSVCFHMLPHWRHLLLCPKHKSCMMAAWRERRLRHLALRSLRCSNPVLQSTPAWLHLHDCLLNFCFSSIGLPLVLWHTRLFLISEAQWPLSPFSL